MLLLLLYIVTCGALFLPSHTLVTNIFLTIVDGYSRCAWIYLLKAKSDISISLERFHKMVFTRFNQKIKIIRSDNGTEFFLNSFYTTNGIIHQTSCVETPQQSDIAEKKHQHLLQVARVLLLQSCLPLNFWSECIRTTTHMIN